MAVAVLLGRAGAGGAARARCCCSAPLGLLHRPASRARWCATAARPRRCCTRGRARASRLARRRRRRRRARHPAGRARRRTSPCTPPTAGSAGCSARRRAAGRRGRARAAGAAGAGRGEGRADQRAGRATAGGRSRCTATQLQVLPVPAPFDSRAEAPQPLGLVGADRSRRLGRRHRVRRHPPLPRRGPAAPDQLAGLAAHRRAARRDAPAARRTAAVLLVRRRAGRPRPLRRRGRRGQQPRRDGARGRGARRAPRPRAATGSALRVVGGGGEHGRLRRRGRGTCGGSSAGSRRLPAGEPHDDAARAAPARRDRRHRRDRAVADARPRRWGRPPPRWSAAGCRCWSSTPSRRTRPRWSPRAPTPGSPTWPGGCGALERDAGAGAGWPRIGCPVVAVARAPAPSTTCCTGWPGGPAAAGAGPMTRASGPAVSGRCARSSPSGPVLALAARPRPAGVPPRAGSSRLVLALAARASRRCPSRRSARGAARSLVAVWWALASATAPRRGAPRRGARCSPPTSPPCSPPTARRARPSDPRLVRLWLRRGALVVRWPAPVALAARGGAARTGPEPPGVWVAGLAACAGRGRASPPPGARRPRRAA